MLLTKLLKTSIWLPCRHFFVFRYKNIFFTIFGLASVKKRRNFHSFAYFYSFTYLYLYFTIFFIVLASLNKLYLLDCISASPVRQFCHYENVKCLWFSGIISHEITKHLNTITYYTVCMLTTALKDLMKYDSANYFLACKTFENKEPLGLDSGDM